MSVPPQWESLVTPQATAALNNAVQESADALGALTAACVKGPQFSSPSVTHELVRLMNAAESLLAPPVSGMLSVVNWFSRTLWLLWAETDPCTGSDRDMFSRQTNERRFRTGTDVLDVLMAEMRHWSAIEPGNPTGPPGSAQEKSQPTSAGRLVSESAMSEYHPTVQRARALVYAIEALPRYCSKVWHEGRPWYGVAGPSAVADMTTLSEALVADAARPSALYAKILSEAAQGVMVHEDHDVSRELEELLARANDRAHRSFSHSSGRRTSRCGSGCLLCANSTLSHELAALRRWLNHSPSHVESRRAARPKSDGARKAVARAVERLRRPFDSTSQEPLCSHLLNTERRSLLSDTTLYGPPDGIAYNCVAPPPVLEFPAYGRSSR